MDHAEHTSLRMADLAAGRACCGLSRGDEHAAEKSGRDDGVVDGVRPAHRNRAQRSLDTIFASQSFQDWQRRLGEMAKRDAEKRAARRSEPSNSVHIVSVEARREHGTYRTIRGRVA